MTSNILEITDEEQFIEVTTNCRDNKIISLYFYSNEAKACQSMSTVYCALGEDPRFGNYLFLSIDANKLTSIAKNFEIESVPFFVFVKNDEMIYELSTTSPKEFVDFLPKLELELKVVMESMPERENYDELIDESDEETEEELNERLKMLTNAAPVMVFLKGTPSDPKCGFSRQIIGILRENNLRFGYFDILKDKSVRDGLKAFSDWPTFPQLYINGEFQGGLDIIKENVEKDPGYFIKSTK
ncbi:hypothetical protein TPHA_0A01910 [Tetrapisispora phaffii CBS 4417]|uniref:Uncharacterized protein n=1 Tax=Tetrapisispora phaffii (strain ATCC 24235 / CBS 4417 / NBRC 1672 / NRRL Y-8282 / UCD 70-5) TaxID=1071381 RepID=G8BMZ6_TETPH|nr:hypothetical protein TPHA_0A01910 [Tetrapisispora phaffii CBS 4417]CCE61274.1 hypothetical protein TPHA_0A01910 [Tetrapisispora phaffii CBS 4417]